MPDRTTRRRRERERERLRSLAKLLPEKRQKQRHPVTTKKAPSRRVRWSLVELEDRRTYHPEAYFRPARSRRRSDDAVVVSTITPSRPPTKRDARFGRPSLFMPRDKFRFTVPKHVAICIRRKQRRETLFALSKTEKGSRQRRRRRNHYSDVSCR